MTVIPVAEARAHFSRLVEEAASTHERFEITRNGRRVAVLVGADDFDSLQETLAVLADAELLRDHLDGIAALAAGNGREAGELRPYRA